MHLKSLTLRGFKSFASSTHLHFEPGITCVVGPNGSGKSNVVDALAWVMGEQGAKSLRGGKMEDVIFAGTSGRPPLGRAEVVVTIDNSDGALPIDYTEVTISRIMFRNGGSEYAINGNPCRLLDVQELLSDSGIGREMHVIVGQGQLDSILAATPDDRRGFIEEAAGVLKHRKRKEKALRKLDAMQANLARVTDLTAELRRQLKPLGRQAEVARRAAVVQADLRDSRLRLLADDLIQQRSALEAEVADETALRLRRAEVEQAIADAKDLEAEQEERLRAEAPRVARAQETWYRLSGLRERLRGTASLAQERVRILDVPVEEDRPGRDPETLEREAAHLRADEAQLAADLERLGRRLADASSIRAAAEAANADEERRVTVLLRAAADRREGLARLAGQVAAARSRLETRGAEIARLVTALDEARSRESAAQQDFTALESQIAGVDEGEIDLDAEHGAASAALGQAEQAVRALREDEREAERERTSWSARKEALELGLAGKDGHGTLVAAAERISGVLGSVAALLHVEPGHEVAVAAALGACADAVAVADADTAVAAFELLKGAESGRVGLVIAAPADPGHQADGVDGWPPLPAPCRYAIDLVTAPAQLRPALVRLLERVAVVPDIDAARSLAAAYPGLVAVTRDGDVLGLHHGAGGGSGAPTLLEVQSAVDEAAERLTEATHRGDRLRFELAQAEERLRLASDAVEATLARLHESDSRMSALAERLGQLGQAVRAAHGEAERLAAARTTLAEHGDRDAAALRSLEERLAAAESTSDEREPSTVERDRLATAATQARHAEVDARLALRTAEERSRALSGRAEAIEASAAQERAARAAAEQRRLRAIREVAVATAVVRGAEQTARRLEHSLALAAQERAAAEEARTALEAGLVDVRARLRDLAGDLETLVDSVAPRRGRAGRTATAHRADRNQGDRRVRRRPGDLARGVRTRPARPTITADRRGAGRRRIHPTRPDPVCARGAGEAAAGRRARAGACWAR